MQGKGDGFINPDALPLALIDVPVNPATQATKAYAIHTDHLGTPMRLTDTTGTVVWALDSTPFDAIHGAFGLPNEDVDLNGISTTYNARFPGQYFDAETGLNYNYFRDYDPGTGRYIQSDPIGLAGGMNTYAYVYGNPLRFIDPFGLKCTVDQFGTKACDTPEELGFDKNWSKDGSNGAFGQQPDTGPFSIECKDGKISAEEYFKNAYLGGMAVGGTTGLALGIAATVKEAGDLGALGALAFSDGALAFGTGAAVGGAAVTPLALGGYGAYAYWYNNLPECGCEK